MSISSILSADQVQKIDGVQLLEARGVLRMVLSAAFRKYMLLTPGISTGY